MIAVNAESVFFDIGYKSEGILPLAALQGETLKPGDKALVTVKGRDPDGYYELSRFKVERPMDWTALEKSFADKSTHCSARLLPWSKAGSALTLACARSCPLRAAACAKPPRWRNLVGQEIRCRIIKLDVTDEDVVVDRRAVAEEEERSAKDRLYSQIKEGDTVSGTVRSLTDYGAFVDLGGVDALLHVSDIAWGRVNKPADVLSVGQQIEVKVLKLATDADKRRISVGLKQLQPHPWDAVAEKLQGRRSRPRHRHSPRRIRRIRRTRTRHRGPDPYLGDVLVEGQDQEGQRRREAGRDGRSCHSGSAGGGAPNIARAQAGTGRSVGRRGAEVPVGSAIEGPVTNLTKFGAFVQLSEGIEGMVHVSDISAEKRINQPADVLRVGQMVKAQVLAIDLEKRQIRLGMKQLVPTGIDEYLAEHSEGDVVTGRLMDDSGGQSRVELGDGIHATCKITAAAPAKAETSKESKADLSSLSSMLQARWKTGSGGAPKAEPVRAGQVRSFRIVKLDRSAKKIDLELA